MMNKKPESTPSILCFFLKEIDIYFYGEESTHHAEMKIGLRMS